MEVVVSKDKTELSKRVGEYVNNAFASYKASGTRKDFMVALSGGSAPKLLADGLLAFKDNIDFGRWQVFLADERYVGNDHADSNLRACRESFLNQVSVPKENVHGIDISVPVEEAAKKYQENLAKVAKVGGSSLPVFDLIILGMGPDGHTCSLFPGHELLDETRAWVASISDSPKPPPERITLTYPVLNAAKNVYFLAAGAEKKEMLVQAAVTDDKLKELGSNAVPAARVRPKNGSLVWFVDEPAAEGINN